MSKTIYVLIALLVCHQIITIYTYWTVCREDRGIYKKETKRMTVSDFLLMLPMFGNAIYEISLGLVDHLRERRLCNMLYDKDQIIDQKSKEIEYLQNLNKDLRSTISELSVYKDSYFELYRKSGSRDKD